MNVNEINAAILSSDLTTEELMQISTTLKFKREQITVTNKRKYSVGEKVQIRSTRGTWNGTIQKINKKNAVVQMDDSIAIYNVPMELIYDRVK